MKTLDLTCRLLSRRSFIRGAGVALSLPFLDAMRPAFGTPAPGATPPRRLLAVCNNLGFLPEHFFPERSGRDFTLPAYLQHVQEHRDDFTIFSGVSHPEVDGAHASDNCFLTAAPHPGRGGFRNSQSLDQFAASQLGRLTRFPSLTLGVNVDSGKRSLSWTNGGVLIPCEQSPSRVFKQLFIQGTAAEVEAQLAKLRLGQSILDTVSDHARSLQRSLGASDRSRLDQYYTGVRDLDQRLARAGEWEKKPKPVINATPPNDIPDAEDYMPKVRLMYDMARLALETDSTRLITLMLDSVHTPAINLAGINADYHNLSHHGKSSEKLAQLRLIDTEHMKLLAGLLDSLKGINEDGVALIDRTMVLYGSNLGDASAHTTTNMPVLLAGGGFKHGQHLAFDRKRNYPLPNLFVSIMQRLGIETDRFASSTGTMRGLELA